MAASLGEGTVKLAFYHQSTWQALSEIWKGPTQMTETYWIAISGSSMVIGLMSEGSISLWLPGPEELTGFLVEHEFMGRGIGPPSLGKVAQPIFPLFCLSTFWTGSRQQLRRKAIFFPNQWPSLLYLKQDPGGIFLGVYHLIWRR